MGGGEWWNETGDYNPSQTAQATDQFDQNTVYTPPGEMAPADQWNFTPDPNAPGGYQAAAPGSVAPLDQAQFSNTTGQYPNDQSMSTAISNQSMAQYSNIPTVNASGDATTQQPGVPAAGAVGGPMGYTNWGRTQVPIIPQYMQYLNNPAVAPGYIPGSGSYNQFQLNQPFLFGTEYGQPVNYQYGSGGQGDPTHGATAGDPQNPAEWISGGKLFVGDGTNLEDRYSPLGNLFGRSDTPSGLGSPAVPQWAIPLLVEAIQKGRLTPTGRGAQYLQQMWGVSPAMWGGRTAPDQGGTNTPWTYFGGQPQNQQGGAVRVGGNIGNTTTTANAPGQIQPGSGTPAAGAAGSNAAGGPMGPGTEVFNYNRDRLALDAANMNTQNKQFNDQLAFNKAVQDWVQKYQQNQMAMGYLGLTSQLRGPADLFQYMRVLGGTPQGIRDVVNEAAGAYRAPMTGAIGTGGTSGPATIDTVLAQMNDPNYGAEGRNLNLPAPNQISAQALMRMTDTQRTALMAAYEAQGWRPQDVANIFKNSLPQYMGQGAAGGAGHVALF
jgi:hypothetical protein